MSSFSGVTFVLFRFRFRCCAFIEAAALRSIVLRYAGAPTATSQLGDVTFSEYLSLLYGEYVVRFPLPVGAFLSCDHGLDFDINSLCKNSINQSFAVNVIEYIPKKRRLMVTDRVFVVFGILTAFCSTGNILLLLFRLILVTEMDSHL